MAKHTGCYWLYIDQHDGIFNVQQGYFVSQCIVSMVPESVTLKRIVISQNTVFPGKEWDTVVWRK